MLNQAILWLFDHPCSWAEFLATLRRVTGDADDVECFILDVPGIDLSDQQAALTTRVQLYWTDSRTWEEIELNALMHLGLTASDDAWKIDYLGFTHPPAPDRSAAGLPVASEAAGFAEDLSYFQVTESDWVGPTDDELGTFAGATGSDLDPKTESAKGWVPLYIHESVLADVIHRVMKSK